MKYSGEHVQMGSQMKALSLSVVAIQEVHKSMSDLSQAEVATDGINRLMKALSPFLLPCG